MNTAPTTPTALLLAAALPLAGTASAAPVLLNEYNAVSGGKQLDDGDGADALFGTIDGNGGNWFELLVVETTDLRGWRLDWTEAGEEVAPGVPAAGSITLSGDTAWSAVRGGTLVTFIEDPDAGGLDTSTDASVNPDAGDWWINVSTRQEQALPGGLVTTTTNDGAAGDFSTGKDGWALTILDAAGAVVAGPTGETDAYRAFGGADGTGGDGVGSEDGFALEGLPRGATRADHLALTATSPFYADTGATTFGSLNADLQDDGTFLVEQDVSALRVVPEPGSAALALAGAALLAARRRR